MGIMVVIGGVWLFAVIAGLDISTPPQQIIIQRRFDTLAQCEQAKAELLRRHPHAYATCDR